MTLDISGGLVNSGWSLKTSADTLGVLFRSNGFPKRLIVTFDQLSAFNHARESVSGDGVVQRCEADHLHLATTGTSWFQTAEIFSVLPVMQEICGAYEEVILYGHSMGGYAALLLSGPLKATNVVAFAPQFSVDPKRVPFETRFNGYVQNLAFVYDDMPASISTEASKYIVYDPQTEQDRKHVDLIRACSNARLVPLSFAGHFPGQFLKEAGCLSQTVEDLLLSRPNDNERRLRIRVGRRRSHRYFLERAALARRRGKTKDAFRLASIAYVLEPSSTSVIETFHALLMSDNAYYGVSHAMVRLIMLERPSWTYYEGTLNHIWKELEQIAAPIIGKKQDP